MEKRKVCAVLDEFAMRDEDVQFGSVVWGRVTGYPWWPAKVTLNEQADVWKKNGKFWVSFFNDDHGAWLPPKVILPWNQKVIKWCIPSSRKYRERVEKAVGLAEEHLKLIESYSAPFATQNPLLLPESGAPLEDEMLYDMSQPFFYGNVVAELDEPEWFLSSGKRKRPGLAPESDDEQSTSKRLREHESVPGRGAAEISPLKKSGSRDPLETSAEIGAAADAAQRENASGDEQSSTHGIDVRGLGKLPVAAADGRITDVTSEGSGPKSGEFIAGRSGINASLDDKSHPETGEGAALPPVRQLEDSAGDQPAGRNPASIRASMRRNDVPPADEEEDTETESEGKVGDRAHVPSKEWDKVLHYIRRMEVRVRELESQVSSLQKSRSHPVARGASSVPSTSSPASASLNTILRMFGDPESAALRASLEALQTSASCFLQAKKGDGTLEAFRSDLDRVIPPDSDNFLYRSIAAHLLLQRTEMGPSGKLSPKGRTEKTAKGNAQPTKKPRAGTEKAARSVARSPEKPSASSKKPSAATAAPVVRDQPSVKAGKAFPPAASPPAASPRSQRGAATTAEGRAGRRAAVTQDKLVARSREGTVQVAMEPAAKPAAKEPAAKPATKSRRRGLGSKRLTPARKTRR